MQFQYEFGTPGGSLQNAASSKYQNTAATGASGEVRTANLLRKIQQGRKAAERFAVIHDVMLPSSKYTANIDHIVVAGRQVLIIDSKVWSSGVYATIRGKTYVYHSSTTKNDFNKRLARFEPADLKTLPMTVNLLDKWLQNASISYAVFMRPALLIWPPSGKTLPFLWLYRPQGTTDVLTAKNALDRLALAIPHQTPDRRLLDQLLTLRSG